MQGDEQVGEQSPTPAACLQPHKSEPASMLAPDAMGCDVPDDLHDDGFTSDERAEAEKVAARMARLRSDRNLVEKLRAGGFEGPAYEAFKATLAGYAYPVVLAWIRRREIYQLSFERGRPVRCPDSVRDHLAHDVDDRQELAMEVVAHALRHFRNVALEQARWNAEGGAALTTFFPGAVLQVFPNVFRAWVKEHLANRGLVHPSDTLLDARIQGDPADLVCTIETFREALKAATSEQVRQTIAALVVWDTPYAEIAAEQGTTEDAVKQQMYRWRKRYRDERQGG